jgi:hypothetical protein
MYTPEQIQQLANLQACKDASEELQAAIAKNTIIANNNKAKSDQVIAAYVIWKGKKDDQDAKLHEWGINSGRYSYLQQKYNSLKNEVKLWKNCIDGNFHCRINSHDHWCKNDIGNDWANHTGCVEDNCGSYRRGKCQRTQSALDRDFNTYKNREKPQPFTEPAPKANEGIYTYDPPVDIPQVAINCCSNYTNVNAGNNSNVELQNIAQSCDQSITQLQQEIKNITQAPITEATEATKATEATEVQQEPLQAAKKSNNQQKIEVIFFIVCILVMLISLSSATTLFFL